MYTKPSITELGSLADLTQDFNKIGKRGDSFAKAPIVGSLVEIP